MQRKEEKEAFEQGTYPLHPRAPGAGSSPGPLCNGLLPDGPVSCRRVSALRGTVGRGSYRRQGLIQREPAARVLGSRRAWWPARADAQLHEGQAAMLA
jgi:hypothetical protein